MSAFSIFIAIMAFLLLAFITSIPLFENFKKYSTFKRIYTTAAIVFLFIIGSFDVYLRMSEPTELSKVIEAINKIATAIGFKDKSTLAKPVTYTKSNNIPPKPPINNFAILRLSSMGTGFMPILSKTTKEDSLLIDYKIINYGNVNAYNFKVQTMMVTIVNGKIIMNGKITNNSYNSSVIIYPTKTNEGQSATTSIRVSHPPIDSTYFCFKIDFSDNTKKRKSFTKIFQVNPDHLYLNQVEDMVYNNIEKFLIKNKYWKPPFKQ